MTYQRRLNKHGEIVSLGNNYIDEEAGKKSIKRWSSSNKECEKKNNSVSHLIQRKAQIFAKVNLRHGSLNNMKTLGAFTTFLIMLLVLQSIRPIIILFIIDCGNKIINDPITYEYLLQDLRPEQALWRGMRQEIVTVIEQQRQLSNSKQVSITSPTIPSTQLNNEDKEDIRDTVNPSLELVISHCDRSLDWIFEDLTSDNVYFGNDHESSSLYASPNIVNITVFSKCGWPVEGIPPKYPYKLVRLPNVGRNDHSFAHWLSHQDPSVSLKNVVLFLKDNSNNHRRFGRQRPLREAVYIAQGNAGFGCREERMWHYAQPLQGVAALWNGEKRNTLTHHKPGLSFFSCAFSYFHYRTKLLKFTINYYERLSRDHGNMFESPYADIEEWLEEAVFAGNPRDFSSLFSSSDTLVPVCYGGNFAARRSQIGRNPVWLYKNIASSLERGNNIAEGHFAERSWAALLSNPLSKDDEQALLDYQSSGRSPWCQYNPKMSSAMTMY